MSKNVDHQTWTIVRFILGQAQVIGATMTLVFLLQTGESNLTIVAGVITALITLASLLLFKGKRKVAETKRT